MVTFSLKTDIPDLSSKVIVITGGTNGLGKTTINALAAHNPHHIIFTGRNASSAQGLIDSIKTISPSINIEFVECDHTSLSNVSKASKEILAKAPKIDVLICNAGIMATDPGLTSDGYENQFAVNHIAHALIVKTLLPAVEKAAADSGDGRIIHLTSAGFLMAPPKGIHFDELQTVQDYGPGSQWTRYGQSKLANVIYTTLLSQKYPSITSTVVHPGATDTDIIRRLKPEEKDLVESTTERILTPEEGVLTTCWCATTKKENLTNGRLYYPICEPGPTSEHSTNQELADKLWTWTQDAIAAY